jgi:ABC-type dipeptide/oligopeptide/nickel transport system permease component
LPILALAIPAAAVIERIHSQAIRVTLKTPHIQAAAGRGVPRSRIVWKHATREALGMTLSVYGVLAGTLLSGSFAVELVADWPGLAMLTADAVRARDPFLVCGCSAAAAILLAVAVLSTDILHSVADPRLGRS